jgi:hypothetical protein
MLGAVGGCASTSNSRFYTLNSVAPTTPVADTAAPSIAPSVSVGPVSVSALLDRPQIVVTNGPNQVTIDEFNRWASPLQDNIAVVVAENLVTMLGTPRVTVFPQSAAANAAYHVTINVQAMQLSPGVSANLDAVWTLRRNTAEAQPMVHRTSVTEATQDSGYDALIAAQSRAVARMSREIADAIRADSRGKS